MDNDKLTRVIIVIGPPGSGKGTNCKLLCEKHGFIHVSTGDLCRFYIEKKNDIGKKLEPYIRNGQLVPDVLMIDVINRRLREADAISSNGVLLDGYPRTAHQAKALVQN